MAWHKFMQYPECSSLRGVTTTEFLESSCHVQNQDGGSDGAITGAGCQETEHGARRSCIGH